MNIQPGSSIGRYHIQEQLGEGGMATVYKAYDTRLERDVAIKVIRTGAFPPDVLDRILKRFDREAKSLARLNHPNIVGIIDYGEQDGTPYLVMPFYPSGTLKQSLGKPMPPVEAARLLVPVARALAYAHQQGILHRDVKPSNILITGSGEPVLTDFGIAKLLENDSGATLTGTGVGVGTPEYMAPEQGMGREIDGRADVYALGVVLYELVTGRKPYTANTPMAVIFMHMTDPLPRPKLYVPDLPDRVEQIIFKAMAKKPEDRYQSMNDLAAELATFDVHLRKHAVIGIDSQPSSPQSILDLYDVYEEGTGEATVAMGETPPSSSMKAEPTGILAQLYPEARQYSQTSGLWEKETVDDLNEPVISSPRQKTQVEPREQKNKTPDPYASSKQTRSQRSKVWIIWLIFGLVVIGVIENAIRSPIDSQPVPAQKYEGVYTASLTPTNIPTNAPTKAPTTVPTESISIRLINEIKSGQKEIVFGGYEWQVLAVEDSRALLITKEIVGKGGYDASGNYLWETNDIRKYLNNDFFNQFDDEEKKLILAVENVNKDNPYFGTDGGNNTTDNIFLLSLEEVVEYFGDSGQLHRPEIIGKIPRIDDQYNHKRIATYNGEPGDWWLRSRGSPASGPVYVVFDGTIYMGGAQIWPGLQGLRPALWLDLKL